MVVNISARVLDVPVNIEISKAAGGAPARFRRWLGRLAITTTIVPLEPSWSLLRSPVAIPLDIEVPDPWILVVLVSISALAVTMDLKVTDTLGLSGVVRSTAEKGSALTYIAVDVERTPSPATYGPSALSSMALRFTVRVSPTTLARPLPMAVAVPFPTNIGLWEAMQEHP